jgi:Tol biopolymer transport system component
VKTTDRLAGNLPDLMAELAPPRVPDYFDDILRATASTRQRPAWTSLERWLPMDIAARPAPLGLPSWRPLVMLVVIAALLVAIGATLLIGAKPALPPEFGVAKNGVVVYSGRGGDIMSLDPATGETAVIIGGDSNDWGPGLSPDGRSILFLRGPEEKPMLYTAGIDGSDVKEFATAKDADWTDWSLDSRRIIYIADGGGTPYIRDVSSGAVTAVPVAAPVRRAYWLSSTRLLLYAETYSGDYSYSTIDIDGTNATQLTTRDSCCGESVLRPQGLLAWTSWTEVGFEMGRIHVLDLATGTDTLLASTEESASHFLDPHFSPDGKWLSLDFARAGATGAHLVLIAADGTGEPIHLGPSVTEEGAQIERTFSPDGKQLLANYPDGSSWLFDVPAGTGGPVEWNDMLNASWQRVAP